MEKKIFGALAGAGLILNAFAGELPVVQDVDVVVAGGSSAAVAAAVAAKEAGATVFLAAPRPYLGEDLAGTLHLARVPGDDESHPVYRAIFDGRRAARPSWPFTYSYDATPDKLHADEKKTVLSNGSFGNAVQDSVQFPCDVVVSVDLGAARDVSGVELSTYLREQRGTSLRTAGLADSGFRTAAMEVSASRDGKSWSPIAFSDKPAVRGTTNNGILTVPLEGQWRYLRVRAVKDAAYSRQLLGELRVVKGDSAVAGLVDRVTPFAVKRTLDEALLAAGVPYLTGAVPCGVLKDADGRACGIVIADRSGRQAIRAKVVIDATPRGRIARLAGAAAEPFKAGTRTFSRVVLSGERPKDPRVRVTQLPGVVPVTVTTIRSKIYPNEFDAHFWRCEMDVEMPDGSARSFAAAEQVLRDATFTPLQADAANTAVLAGEPSLRVPDGGNVFALDAEERPGAAIANGARVGAAAATAAKSAPAPRGVLSVCSALPGEKLLDMKSGERVGEHAKALPNYLVKASGTVADAASLPLLATCDTFVVGAGTGGGPAGISAARAGAKTIVCEFLYMMGGVSTDGLIGLYYFGNRVGFTHEIDEGVKTMGAVFPQAKSEWYRHEQRRAGAEIWFGTMLQGVIVDGTRVTGVVVVMPDGTRGAVRCSNVVDSTGNAEVPALAGADTEYLTDTELSVQGAGIARNTLGTGYANSDLSFVDDTDAADLFYFALRSRASLPADTWDQAQIVNSRERRRMVGAFYMTPPDVMNGRTYPDTVVRTYSNFDSHGQTAHDAFFIEDPGHKPMYVNLPYRCLLPKTLDGVLVTGLGISAHRDAMPILRMEPDVQNQGYAAGWAAANAAKAGVAVRDIDVKALQAHLVEKKVIDADVPKQTDSFPLSDEAFAQAVRDIADDYKGLGVLMTDPDRARPLLAGSYTAAEGEAKFNYAHLLAMLGRDDGAALVLAKFQAMDWDKGWNYRGMGQFNRSVSWADSYAIALGHAKVRAAVPALIEKADKLTEKSEYSHFRAVARALEEIGDTSAAPALARVLQRPGIGGHAQRMQANVPVFEGYSNKAGDWERTLSLREICIARALYRLGDTPDGLGRRTLEAYAADPRRAFATHAQLVLGKIDIRCDYPGGNVKVLGIDEKNGVVNVAPDLRDTAGKWFHWAFTVRGAAGRTIHFRFPQDRYQYLSSLGPAISRDGGASWTWLRPDGTRHEPANAFDYTFAPNENETRFAVAIPYTQKDWDAFMAKWRGRGVECGVLCKSQSGTRDTEIARIPCRARAKWLFVFTARHHACEASANPAMEGVMEEILSGSPEGEWVRANADCAFVPFMDKDGVENGDQGKNRRPHDHNRDYLKDLYTSVRAIKELMVKESVGKQIVFVDLHSPHVRSLPTCPEQDQVFSFGSSDERLNAHWNTFRANWKATQKGGALVYDGKYDIHAGKGHDAVLQKASKQGFMGSRAWVETLPNCYLSTCCEFGYSLCGGVYSPPAARELGRNMLKALARTAQPAAEITGANTEVVVTPDAPPATRFAAAEMTNYLSRVLGHAIPLVPVPTEGRYAIVLGTNAWSRAAGLRPEALPRDSYCVKIGPDRAYIAGCDSPTQDPARQIAQGWIGKFERATLFGVYGFLDRHAGVRFYFPGELGTVVPAAPSIRLTEGDYSVTPRFATRDCYLHGAGPYPDVDPADAKAQRHAKAVYSLLLREETDRIPCCHGQNRFKIAERFSESHPEYFQLRKNGTRCIGTKFEHNWMGRQLCHTSKVWDIFREDTLARIRKGERYVDIMPQDGMSACMCENCQRVFNTTDFSLASGYATELIWSNTVAVAKAVTAAGLDGGVSQMAYGTYRDIPSVEIPENVKVVLAVGGPWSESHPDIRDKQIAFVRSWAEKLGRPVSWIWTYPMKNYGRLQARDVPQVAPRAFAKFYTLAEPYIDGSFVESNVGESLVQNYLNFYVFSKLAWDGKIDIEQVLTEHHRLMFGAGAPHMARFFDAVERKWIGEIAVPSLIGETEIGPMLYGPNEIDLWQKIYSRAFLDELDRSLQAAAAAVPSGSLEARRIAWIREELYERAARHQKEFMSLLSPDVERARRAADKNARVVVESGADWEGWSLPKKVLRDGTAVGLVVDGRLYVGCALRGATALKPNTKYRLSYFLKTDKLNQRDAKEGRGGACMEVEQYGKKYSALRMPAATYWNGTRDWIHQSVEFTTNDDVVQLPGYKANLWLRVFNSTGTAWFDGVRLEEVR